MSPHHTNPSQFVIAQPAVLELRDKVISIHPSIPRALGEVRFRSAWKWVWHCVPQVGHAHYLQSPLEVFPFWGLTWLPGQGPLFQLLLP